MGDARLLFGGTQICMGIRCWGPGVEKASVGLLGQTQCCTACQWLGDESYLEKVPLFLDAVCCSRRNAYCPDCTVRRLKTVQYGLLQPARKEGGMYDNAGPLHDARQTLQPASMLQ